MNTAIIAAVAVAQASTWTNTLRPGIQYIHFVDSDTPLVYHALKFKYPTSGIKLEARLAGDEVFGKDGADSLETVGSIAARTGALAAINGDYFGNDGDPLGFMMAGGEIVSEPYVPRSAAAWGSGGVLIDSPRWSGALVLTDGAEIAVDGVDRSARAGEIILNTAKAGVASSKMPCYAFVFDLVLPLAPGKASPVKLRHIFPETTNLNVGENQMVVLAAPGREKELMGKVWVDLVYDFRMGLSGGIDWKAMTDSVGGGPRIIKDGQPYVTYQYERFDTSYTKRHPRTAIGTTAAGEVVLCVVEGRSPFSRGVTLDELATLMLGLGCRDAMNLDGGGSTTMVVEGAAVNRLSDGFMRKVGNAVLLYAPPVIEPRQISISVKPGEIHVGDKTTLSVVDEAGASVSDVMWIGAATPGWVDGDGVFTAVKPGHMKVQAAASGATASVELVVLP
ncbi:MAG TPA: phosphodiester glycosidase family protein [Fimbriimonadales bacterium]|nr:phosphodiester glycosidase family protein [Fimbriimonadales bacterium]